MTNSSQPSSLKIVTFKDEHARAFYDLNHEWITKLFVMEEPDHEQLSNPREQILDPGGQIFIAEWNGTPIGTCALLFAGPGKYELAKMSVSPSARGKGIGRQILQFAADWAREQGASEIALWSHSDLKPALKLYENFGFEYLPFSKCHSEYERCDVMMRLDLAKSAGPRS